VTVHAAMPITPQDKSRELQRKLYLRIKRESIPVWPDVAGDPNRDGQQLESSKKKVDGELDEGKPHVRFDVAGDGNQTR